jgi:hypothetical protein
LCSSGHNQGRESAPTGVFNLGTQGRESIDKIANRTLTHARHAVKLVTALRRLQRQRGGQRPERSARVAEKKRCLGSGKITAATNHSIVITTECFNVDAEFAKCGEHDGGIVRL